MGNHYSKYTTLLYIVGVLFFIWGILGALDTKNHTYRGYFFDDNYKIIKIAKESPAEIAGLQVGDIIKSIGGIAITDTKANRKRQRAKIGETREFVVERNGEEKIVQLTYAEITDKNRNLSGISDFMGLLFIVLGLLAHRKHKTSLSFSFAVFTLCFGFIFSAGGPYISVPFLKTIIDIISTSVILFSFTYLAIYMLKYPPESKFLSSAKNKKLIYIPMIIVLLIIFILEIFRIDGSGTLNMIMRFLFGAFIIFYFGISLITLIQKFVKSSPADRQSKGLNMMLIGTVVGLVPILIYFTINIISPESDLPGNDYMFLTFLAIPIFFTLALNQLYKNTEG